MASATSSGPRRDPFAELYRAAVRSRGRRTAATAGLLAICYFIYFLGITPFIEPRDARPARLAADQRREANSAPRTHDELAALFSADDWELDSPKVLETSGARLLLQDYRNLGEGQVEIRPCTILVLSRSASLSEQERLRRAVVLQAPEGALLTFDRPIDLKQAQIGRLMGGKLRGAITIRSQGSDLGPDDDLWLETRDVDLAPEAIVTPHPVRFRLGKSSGGGRDLRIDLLASPGEGDKQPEIEGLKSIELTRDVKLLLNMRGKGLVPDDRRTARVPVPGADAPVEVSCQGPFHFDFADKLATFSDRVDILRLIPNGPSDRLSCDVLEVHFGRRADPANAGEPSAAAEPKDDAADLRVERLVARGNPVVVQAPSSGVEARGQTLDYFPESRRISLAGEEGVTLRRDGVEVMARALHFQTEAGTNWGHFLAEGPGWIRGAEDSSAAGPFHVQWSRTLRFRPHEGRQVLSIEGQASIRASRHGGLEGDQIHLWLRDSVRPVGLLPRSGGSQPRMEPDRLLADGQVKLESPQLAGNVDRLEVWFQGPWSRDGAPTTTPAVASGRVGGRTGAVRTAGVPRPAPPVARAPRDPAANDGGGLGEVLPVAGLDAGGPRQFTIGGRLLRVQLQMLEGSAHLREATVEDHVQFGETSPPRPNELPLKLTGDRVHLSQPKPRLMDLTVSGQPAHVEARGASLEAAVIRLDGAENRMWIDGTGQMTLPIDRDLDGRAAARRQSLVLTWQAGMQFDGLLARFQRDVVAQVEQQSLRTDVMEVTFNRRIDFSGQAPADPAPAATQAPPDIQFIECQNGVLLERRTTAPDGVLLSHERMQALDLHVDRAAEKLVFNGPGWVRATRRGGEGLGGPLAGATPIGPAAAGPPGEPPAPRGDKLTFLEVRYNKAVHGDTKNRVLVFGDQVKCVYGAVPDWEATLTPDDPNVLAENGVLMTCEKLTVNQAPTAANTAASVEMAATGNPLVEGKEFTARAERITYSAAKDLVVLEGDGRNDAQLWRQPRAGAATARAAARKILFWRSTNRVQIDDARFLDLNQPGKPGSAELPLRPDIPSRPDLPRREPRRP